MITHNLLWQMAKKYQLLVSLVCPITIGIGIFPQNLWSITTRSPSLSSYVTGVPYGKLPPACPTPSSSSFRMETRSLLPYQLVCPIERRAKSSSAASWMPVPWVEESRAQNIRLDTIRLVNHLNTVIVHLFSNSHL